jgi:hypothetical protein
VMLAKKAGALVRGEVVVSAWLYRQTCRLAANRVRGEVRRKRREEEFGAVTETENGTMMMEEIDEALGQLTEQERGLVICRYVEERDYAEMGRRFGVSVEAVRKKVGRAVEKLRVVLAKRGVGVSASALTVGLVGLGGARASAGLVMSVSGAAVQKGVVSGSGMFSLVGILAGALGVSVVMGGVRMMEGEEAAVSSVMESGRVLRNGESVLTRIRNTGAAGRSLSDEEIWENLVMLDGEPMTVVTDLLVEEVLRSVPGERFFEFIDEADKRVSVKMKERLCYSLLEKAVETAPIGTVEGILEKGVFEMRNPKLGYSSYLGVHAVVNLFSHDLEAASAWVIENWWRFEEMGEEGSVTESRTTRRRQLEGGFSPNDMWVDVVGRATARAVYHVEGFQGVEAFAKNFDDEMAATMWRNLMCRSGVGLKEGEFYPVQHAEYLATLPDHEPFGGMKELAWLTWYERWGSDLKSREEKVTKEEYMSALPGHSAADFKKSCLDEVHRIEKRGEK